MQILIKKAATYENKQGVLPLGCWAHVRRKYEEALKEDKVRAEYALELQYFVNFIKFFFTNRMPNVNNSTLLINKNIRWDTCYTFIENQSIYHYFINYKIIFSTLYRHKIQPYNLFVTTHIILLSVILGQCVPQAKISERLEIIREKM